jgi:NAD(P)-dependent dehydrogenase (short-subunit alcohol dehydrogenase family)
LTVQADVSRPEDIRRMFKEVQAAFGRLDIFVSNALGEVFTYYRPPLDITPEQWDKAVDSQAKAFLVGVQEAAHLAGNGGRIVAITYRPGVLTAGWQPAVAHCSAKAALESLVRYFAVALASRGITVNAISPGVTEDSVLNSFPPDTQDGLRAWHRDGWTPMGRLGTPADIGNAVALLCSEEADWITGQVIVVDGGASLMNPDFPLEIQRG